MEIEYDLTEEDLLAFQRYHRRNPPGPRRGGVKPGTVVSLIVFGIALVAATLLYLFSDNTAAAAYLLVVPYFCLGALLAVVGVILYARLMQPRILMRTVNQGRNAEKVLGWRRLAIDAEGVCWTSQFSSLLYLWRGIDRIASTPDHAFFYINTVTAILLPQAAFRDEAAFKEFVDTARRYYRMGRMGDGRGGGAAEPDLPTVLPVEDSTGVSEGITPKDVGRSFGDRPEA